MSHRRLGSFLSLLEERGELHRISVPVDPALEITEIVLRVMREQGPALLFENVKGSGFPLYVNGLGTTRRLEWALGKTPAEIGAELGALAEAVMPPSPAKLWRHRTSVSRVLSMPPRFSTAPLRNNTIEPADLDRLPIAQSWPEDGGPFLTFPLVITRNPSDGRQNMGVYRMHKYNKTQTGMHWQIGKGGGYHYQQAEARNQPLPLAVALGADPILMMCGVMPLPEGLDEMMFAGFLRGERTRVTKLPASGLRVPAEAEFVLEGFVRPFERRMEGPYGDHFGHYSLAAPFPVFNVDRVWHRDGAVFPISVVGKPPQEDQVIGDAVQEILLPLIKVMHPEIVDLWAYMEAGFHNLLVIAVKQRFQKEAVKSALWALGEGQLSLTKCVVVVDSDVNARSFAEVMEAVRAHFDPAEDFLLLPGTSQDTLDFTSFKMNLGSKMILDATRGAKPAPMAPPVDRATVMALSPEVTDARFVHGALLVVQVDGPGRPVLDKMVASRRFSAVPLIAAVSRDVPLDDPTLLIWGLFTRFDCQRDTFFESATLKNGHPAYAGPLLIDATWKPGYPKPVEMSPEIVTLVDRRWREYGFKSQ